MGKLFIVATPIGNLGDITLRAIDTLKRVGLVACEDTRITRVLLQKYDIKTPTTSYAEHNKTQKLSYLIDQLRFADLALVSDAGMPGINDPAYELVNECIKSGIEVTIVPGPSAVLSALVASGLPIDQFTYLGYIPRSAGERGTFLEAALNEKRTVALLETPHRLTDSLIDILDIGGDRPIAVCRELTKLHEEIFRGTVSQALEHFKEPRGEFTLVISGRSATDDVSDEAILARLKELISAGKPKSEAVKDVTSEFKTPRKRAYQISLQLDKS
ncbi:MAG: 16S rRNA (cytidine(1402)-2'-O)-methyltransferase [Dehalococcoidia bacterium]|nr:16S rRNA (cytidine(1402)-2'-O)-methyltransferase [Dehalococcoidia bacterium]